MTIKICLKCCFIFFLNILKRKKIIVKSYQYLCIWLNFKHVKGTGTPDLIRLKVVSLDRSWLVGLTDDL